MQVPVLNKEGKSVGTLTIDEASLGGVVNPALLKQAYVRYHANKRQGSARTKNRGRVEGSTRKLYKQKGTGNARMGAVRTNIRRGGGRAFAKLRVREDYHLDMPIKMRRLANRNALLAKLIDNEVRVVDSMKMAEPKTKAFAEFLGALKVDRSALVALGMDNDAVRKSARNVESVQLVPANQLNAFDLLNNRYLVIAKSDLEAFLAGPWSQTTKEAKLNPLGAKKEAA